MSVLVSCAAHLVAVGNSTAHGADASQPMCVRYPILRNLNVGIPAAALAYLLMLLPAIYTSITEVNVYSLPTGQCPHFWSDLYLLAYGIIFFLVFAWFAWDLRAVADSYA
jgi:hypothetical protein